MNVYMPFLAVFNDFFYDFDGFFKYVDFSYDNFPYYRCRQYSEAEMDRSTHPGSAEVVIKPIIAPSQVSPLLSANNVAILVNESYLAQVFP